MLVSGVQKSDSDIHIHISILFQILFPYRFLPSITQDNLLHSLTFNVDTKMYRLDSIRLKPDRNLLWYLREERRSHRFGVFVVLHYFSACYGFWNNISRSRSSFYPMMRLLFFNTFPLNLLRSKIMNKPMLDRLKGFSFRELLVGFKLEQTFSSLTCKLLIKLHTTGCRLMNIFMDHGAWLGI